MLAVTWHAVSAFLILYNAVGAVIIGAVMFVINLHLRLYRGTPQGRWWSACLGLLCAAVVAGSIQRQQTGDYDLRWGSYVTFVAITVGLIGYALTFRDEG